MKIALVFALLAILVVARAGTIVDLAVADPTLSTLVAALTAADLVTTLNGTGPFTVIAPTNAAFDALPAGVVATLLLPANKAALVKVLTYHVIAGSIKAADLKDHTQATSVQGGALDVFVPSAYNQSLVAFNFAHVSTADLVASNGVVHKIDSVVLPPGLTLAPLVNVVQQAQSLPALSTLVSLVVAANLTTTLSGPGPFTILAPTNNAFARLPASVIAALQQPSNKALLTNILKYHVVAGAANSTDLTDLQSVAAVNGESLTIFTEYNQLFVNYAAVIKADIAASNGVIHLVDNVIMPAGLAAQVNALAATAAAPTQNTTQNIVQLAQATPSLKTLVDLVIAANLTTTLSGPGPFTVVAPSNDAFAQLPAAIVTFLKDPKNKAALVSVLTYHVFSGRILAAQLKDRTKALSVQGQNVSVFVEYGTNNTYFNQAQVTTANVLATNGVVHLIDHVILPPGFSDKVTAFTAPTAVQYIGTPFAGTIVDAAEATPALNALVEAVTKAGLVSVLSGPGPFTVFAPTNDAFGLLSASALAALTVDQLTQVLTYHVVAGAAILSTQVGDAQKVATVQNTSLTTYQTTAGGLFVDFASVTALRDIVCTNGVVHVIDHVINPFGAAAPAPAPPTPAPAPQPAPSGGVSTGAIIGIAGGVVVLGAIAWFAYSKFAVTEAAGKPLLDNAYRNMS